MALPRETGGNVPRPKVKVKALQPPKPEVAVGRPKPRIVKVAPEATRPVTPKQRQAINRNADAQQINYSLNRAVLKSQAADLEDRLNRGNLPLEPRVRVNVVGDHLVASHPTFFGLSHSQQVVSPEGQSGVRFHGAATDALADVVPSVGRKIAAPSLQALHVASIPGEKIGRATQALAKHLGAPKSVQTIARLTGEFVLDPTTYATGGYGKAAETLTAKAAEHAAAGNAAKAVKLAQQAEKVGTRRGVSLGFRVNVPGTDKSIEAMTSGAASGKLAAKLLGKPIRERSQKLSRAGEELLQGFRPGHMTEEQHLTVSRAKREQRAAVANADRRVVKTSHALTKALDGHGKAVQDALEQAPQNVRQHLADVAALADHEANAAAAAKALATAQQRERVALRRASTPNRTTELVGAEQKLQRAVRARAKTELATKDAGKIKAVRQRVRDAQAELDGIRATTPTVTPTQAERILRSRADQAQAEHQLYAATHNAEQTSAALAANRVRVSDLPPKVQPVAKAIQKRLDDIATEKEALGIGSGRLTPQGPADAQGYFPHIHQAHFDTKAEDVFRPRASRLSVSKAKGREIRLPLSTLENTGSTTFERDAVKVLAHHETQAAKDVANEKLWRQITSTGRKLTADSAVHFDAGERVYKLEPRQGLTELKEWTGAPDRKAIEKALADKSGHYVVLNRRTVEAVKRDLGNPGSGTGDTLAGRALDRGIGAWKTTVTVANPSYAPRNLVGDLMNAQLADTRVKSLGQSAKVLKALKQRENFRANPESLSNAMPPASLDKSVKVGGKAFRVGDVIDQAEKLGVIRTGQYGSEVRELLGGSAKRARRIRGANEYREDFPRLATFLSHMARGHSPEQAAEWSLHHHFDYGDLTQVERRLRRVFPFYTWWARDTRLQAEKLLTRPGKYATLGKLLDEAARAAGFGSYNDYAATLPENQQRGIAVPVRIGGTVHPVIVGFTQTDLNNIDLRPDQVFQNVAQRISPLKLIPEIYYNESSFFRSQIENPKAPLVPAPEWAQAPGLKNLLGVRTYVKNGQKILGWPAKVDYSFRSLSPQTNAAAQLATTGPGSRNMTRGEQLLSLGTGIRVLEPNRVGNALNALYANLTTAQDKLGSIQQRLGKDPATGYYRTTAETDKLKAQVKNLSAQIGELRLKRGDALNEIPTSQRPKHETEAQRAHDLLYGAGNPRQQAAVKKAHDLLYGGGDPRLKAEIKKAQAVLYGR